MSTQATKPDRKRLIVIGALGCLATFLVAALVGGGILLLRMAGQNPRPEVAISAKNVDQVQQIRRLPQAGFGAKLAWSPDSRLLGVANGSVIKLWEAETGKELQTIALQSDVSGLAFSPDSSLLAVGTNYASLYDVSTGRPIRAFPERVTLPNGWVLSGGMNVAFAPDGRTLAGGMLGGTAILWDISTGKALRTFADPSMASSYSRVAFSPDGNILALAHQQVSLWNVTTGDLIRTLADESDVVMFLSDGKTLLTSSRRWDITTGTSPGGRSVGRTESCMAYSSDGSISAYTPMPNPGFGLEGLFSGPPGTKIETGYGLDLGPNNGCPLAFSPDGRWLATGSDAIKLWGVPP